MTGMDIDSVMRWNPEPIRERYDSRRTILYALGVGAGAQPDELRYVYEHGLEALPTMAVVLATEGFPAKADPTGIDWGRALHGEQGLEMHRPLPGTGDVIGRSRIDGLYDKGPGKDAILVQSRTLHDATTGDLIATTRATIILRGQGGFGGTAEGAPRPHAMPERPFDLSVALPTRPDQAAIYRLSGDLNPLHIDPAAAHRLGFDHPILHGLCSYAIAGRAVVTALCGGDAGRLTRLDVRFSAPVFAGETLVTEIWKEDAGRAAFRVRVAERDTIVLNNGLAEYS